MEDEYIDLVFSKKKINLYGSIKASRKATL
jgi:hypothetical protein